MLKIIGIAFIAIIAIVMIFFIFIEGPKLLFSEFPGFEKTTSETADTNTSKSTEKGVVNSQALTQYGLQTNTTQATVPLEEIIVGGPAKDEIPAITTPSFYSVFEALSIELPNELGIVVAINGETRMYPLNILVWHEIVNDTIGGSPVLVTFSPLSGSAMVFNPVVQSELRLFGVSGLLWESNLLMYDTRNESLWSQLGKRAVVGTDAGTQLPLIDSNLLTLATYAELFPNGNVLQRPNPTTKDYAVYPYGNYNTSDTLMFDTSVNDARLPKKTVLHVASYNGNSYAFKRDDLLTQEEVVVETTAGAITASFQNGIITVTTNEGLLIPGYTTMWFAWAAQHQRDGVVWTR
jgi:hypothetical protein